MCACDGRGFSCGLGLTRRRFSMCWIRHSTPHCCQIIGRWSTGSRGEKRNPLSVRIKQIESQQNESLVLWQMDLMVCGVPDLYFGGGISSRGIATATIMIHGHANNGCADDTVQYIPTSKALLWCKPRISAISCRVYDMHYLSTFYVMWTTFNKCWIRKKDNDSE